jgi:hypothetical protein
MAIRQANRIGCATILSGPRGGQIGQVPPAARDEAGDGDDSGKRRAVETDVSVPSAAATTATDRTATVLATIGPHSYSPAKGRTLGVARRKT